MSDVILSVSDLHVSYGPIRALRGIDLQVHAGETVAIVGANGDETSCHHKPGECRDLE